METAHGRDAALALGHHDQLDPPAGRLALGRPAAVGRRRARPCSGTRASSSSTSRRPRSASPRRARCSTSSSASPSRGSPSCSSRTTSTTSSRSRPASRCCASAATSASTSATRRRQQEVVHRDHGGRPDEGRGHRRDRRGDRAVSSERRRRRSTGRRLPGDAPSEPRFWERPGQRPSRAISASCRSSSARSLIVALLQRSRRRNFFTAGELRQPDRADGRIDHDRLRRRLRAPARRDRPLDRRTSAASRRWSRSPSSSCPRQLARLSRAGIAILHRARDRRRAIGFGQGSSSPRSACRRSSSRSPAC